MSSLLKAKYTREQYLALERQAEHKSEFLNGEIFAMSGASREHNRITVNVGSGLHTQLRGRPCETFISDMRVEVSTTGLYTYPDVVVVCGDPHFEDANVDTLLNPTLIVEVLSPSTEAYDRGEKFAHYRRLPSVKEYVLVAQERCRVERYVRQENDQWLLSEASDLSDTIVLASIDCRLPLAEVYDRVTFPTPGEDSSAAASAPEA
jgi:Uma2 family endonuclease